MSADAAAGAAPASLGDRLRSRAGLRLGVLLAPGFVWLVIFFTVPIALVLVFSFYHFAEGIMTPGFTLDNYARALGTDVYRSVFMKTMRYGLTVTLICLIVGYPVAYFVARSAGRWRNLLFVALIIPFWTTIVVRTFAWKIMLGTNGLVNYGLRELGIIDMPLKFLYTETAVMVGLTHVFLPFMILPLYAVLEKIDPVLEEAAMDLGAGRIRTFLRVTLPLSLPGVSTGCLLVFILTIGSFLTPDILGGPGELMIANVIREEYYTTFNWPFGGALASIFLIITLVMILVYNRLFRFDKLQG
ncbi:MAG: ABC transporter permease [Ectothiorhodospiraceae bacterium]|nr:ABC transporter permease [Chromatiales bacterium]MCP5154337.1 ABC transporter permease [Ectothiorhodospiraceae bacterium]